MPFVLFFFITFVLTLLIFLYKSKKRHGRIRLGGERSSYPIVNGIYEISVLCGEWILDKLSDLRNAIASKWNRHQGYTRVESIPRPCYDLSPFRDDDSLHSFEKY